MMGHRERLRHGNEVDVFTAWRKLVHLRPALKWWVKRKFNRRVRKNASLTTRGRGAVKTIDKILNGLKQALAHARGELPDKTFRITLYSVETGDATSGRQPQKDDE